VQPRIISIGTKSVFENRPGFVDFIESQISTRDGLVCTSFMRVQANCSVAYLDSECNRLNPAASTPQRARVPLGPLMKARTSA
jgi:hypothetical protein